MEKSAVNGQARSHRFVGAQDMGLLQCARQSQALVYSKGWPWQAVALGNVAQYLRQPFHDCRCMTGCPGREA